MLRKIAIAVVLLVAGIAVAVGAVFLFMLWMALGFGLGIGLDPLEAVMTVLILGIIFALIMALVRYVMR